MFPYVAQIKDKQWQPGPYEGIELMVLHKNEITGGVVVLRKFKAGHTIPAHTHPDANALAYVLSGNGRNLARPMPPGLCSSRKKAFATALMLRARKSSASRSSTAR